MKGSAPTIHVVMLLLYFPPRLGGSGSQALRLARQLCARGIGVTVLTTRPPDGSAPRREAEGRFAVRRFSSGPRRTHREKLLFGLQAAAWLARHPSWQILHLHGFGSWAVAPALLARLRGRPVLAKTTLAEGGALTGRARRGGLRSPWSRLQDSVYHGFDAVVAISADLEEHLRSDEGFRNRIRRIPNGVDTNTFRPPEAGERERLRSRLGLRDELVVLSAAALTPRKNVHGLVRAAGALEARPVKLLVAGEEGPFPGYREEIGEAVEQLPEGVEASFLGHRSPEALAELYRAADVFVLNSYAEGLPNALLEAMASALPSIATDVAGSRDLLASGGGLLVPPGDSSALTAALERLASRPELRRTLAAEALDRVTRGYGLASVTEQYVRLYRELLVARGLEDGAAEPSAVRRA